MRILIPMAGEGRRFIDAGYKQHKPVMPVYDSRTGRLLPMVICAVQDLPGVERDGSNIIFVDRMFHKTTGVEDEIKKFYPEAVFISVEELTEGQASTCLLAKKLLELEDSLLIAACDNGMVYDKEKFFQLTKKSDEIVFTYRHNEVVLRDPDAYGWMRVNENGRITGTSIKRAISAHPMNDHAVVATFWFKKAESFIKAAEKMIAENDRINNEFYVDQVAKHMLDCGYEVNAFEIERYICWGTPTDYEEYQKTFEYWKNFLIREGLIKERISC